MRLGANVYMTDLPSVQSKRAAESSRTRTEGDFVVAYSGRKPVWGMAHYSLHYAGQRYITAISKLGIRTVHVPRPEIYGTDISRSFIAPQNERIIHLAFGDYKDLRILKGAYNIACVAWEYESISDSMPLGGSHWMNQAWVLGLFDEIWVGSSFAKSTFQKHGVRNVQIIPPPVPDSINEKKPKIEEVIGSLLCAPCSFDFSMFDASSAHNERYLREHTRPFSDAFYQLAGLSRPTVYLTIVSPGDQRKNVEASILAFARFAAEVPNALLVVKLTCH